MSIRLKATRPFYVLQLLERAQQLESQGQSVIHLEIGEPDFATPPSIIKAYTQALNAGKTRYTSAVGLDALRDKLCEYYWQQFQVKLNRQQVIITSGASGALLTFLMALVHHNGEVLLTDPGYPCNHSMVNWLGGQAINIPVSAEHDYQLTPELIDAHWNPSTLGAIVATPSNPTGTVMNADCHAQLLNRIKHHNGWLITDEIYQGFTYDIPPRSVLQIDNQALVVNSFSKFFAMSGLRLGWLVAPESLQKTLCHITQNISIAPNTACQHAALAAFEPECLTLYEQRRQVLQSRRDLLLAGLQKLGFGIRATPQGAFYIYARLPETLLVDSLGFCEQLLEATGVAITPGMDFGYHQSDQHIRIAYTVEESQLHEALHRLESFINKCKNR